MGAEEGRGGGAGAMGGGIVTCVSCRESESRWRTGAGEAVATGENCVSNVFQL